MAKPQYEPVEERMVRNILFLAKAYISANAARRPNKAKIALSAVSRIAHGDHRAFDGLASGQGSLTLRKYDEAMAKLYERWPEGAVIPVLPFKVRISPAKPAR